VIDSRGIGVLTTVMAVLLAISCSPSGGGLSRPGSERRVDCPTQGFDYTARFTPGVATSPTDSLYVNFRGRRPTSEEAAAILQTCVNATARTIRIDYEMLATAWFGEPGKEEGPLPLPDGSANLTYDPKTGTIKAWSHRAAAIPKVEVTRSGYTVEGRDHKPPVPPNATVVTLDVIFEKPPAPDEVIKILVAEITAVVGNQSPKVNTTAYPRSGAPNAQNARPQVRGANGGFLFAHFNARTGEIRDQDRRLVGTIR
jgi:hypothetical protein